MLARTSCCLLVVLVALSSLIAAADVTDPVYIPPNILFSARLSLKGTGGYSTLRQGVPYYDSGIYFFNAKEGTITSSSGTESDVDVPSDDCVFLAGTRSSAYVVCDKVVYLATGSDHQEIVKLSESIDDVTFSLKTSDRIFVQSDDYVVSIHLKDKTETVIYDAYLTPNAVYFSHEKDGKDFVASLPLDSNFFGPATDIEKSSGFTLHDNLFDSLEKQEEEMKDVIEYMDGDMINTSYGVKGSGLAGIHVEGSFIIGQTQCSIDHTGSDTIPSLAICKDDSSRLATVQFNIQNKFAAGLTMGSFAGSTMLYLTDGSSILALNPSVKILSTPTSSFFSYTLKFKPTSDPVQSSLLSDALSSVFFDGGQLYRYEAKASLDRCEGTVSLYYNYTIYNVQSGSEVTNIRVCRSIADQVLVTKDEVVLASNEKFVRFFPGDTKDSHVIEGLQTVNEYLRDRGLVFFSGVSGYYVYNIKTKSTSQVAIPGEVVTGISVSDALYVSTSLSKNTRVYKVKFSAPFFSQSGGDMKAELVSAPITTDYSDALKTAATVYTLYNYQKMYHATGTSKKVIVSAPNVGGEKTTTYTSDFQPYHYIASRINENGGYVAEVDLSRIQKQFDGQLKECTAPYIAQANCRSSCEKNPYYLRCTKGSATFIQTGTVGLSASFNVLALVISIVVIIVVLVLVILIICCYCKCCKKCCCKK